MRGCKVQPGLLISGMAKKKPAVDTIEEKPAAVQINFRAEDPRLVEALDRYAKSLRRSRNQAMNIALEDALKERGFWPPPQGG